jgi:hypothetical protein
MKKALSVVALFLACSTSALAGISVCIVEGLLAIDGSSMQTQSVTCDGHPLVATSINSDLSLELGLLLNQGYKIAGQSQNVECGPAGCGEPVIVYTLTK